MNKKYIKKVLFAASTFSLVCAPVTNIISTNQNDSTTDVKNNPFKISKKSNLNDFDKTSISSTLNLNDGYSDLPPNALFASPIFPLSDSQEGYDISGQSNDKTSSFDDSSTQSYGAATRYLSVESVSLTSIHTIDKFIPYLGYSANHSQDIDELLLQNNNKMSISQLLKHNNLFAKKPYFSFLQKAYTWERGLVKMQISGKVTLNCQNSSLADPYFRETHSFTSEVELSNAIINDNCEISFPSCSITGIPGSFNKGTINFAFSKNSFFDDIYLEYIPLSADNTIPAHYELSCENNEITLDSTTLEMYGKTSNKIQFDKNVPIQPVNSTDFEFPNFYKIKIDTENINWREFVDESGKKIKYSKAYDIFDGDSYKDIIIPLSRFTFLGFDGNPLSIADIQFWLSKNKDPLKKDNLLFYPQDDFGSSEISYIKDSHGHVTDISIRVPVLNAAVNTNINWYFSSAQGYSNTCIPTETNDPYNPDFAFYNGKKGLLLFLDDQGCARNPDTLDRSPCITKYSLNLKSDNLTTITGQSTIYHRDAYDFISGKYHSLEGRINYEINVSDIHFEISQFNLDSTRRYFELHPEKAANIFSLENIFELQDEFCKCFGEFFEMSCNIRIDGSVNFHFLDYVDGECTGTSKEVEHFDLKDFAISTTDPEKSCSFSKEYGPKSFCTNYITPKFSIDNFDPSTPRSDTIYEMLKFKFERDDSTGDYIPKFFYDDFSHQEKIKFNINTNTDIEGYACASYVSLPTFSFSDESLYFVPHEW